MTRLNGQIGNRSGQSIVEVIIATSIVATAVASALTLTTASLNAQKDNEGWMVATNLAREGTEVVRNLRDSNWLSGRAFDYGLEGNEYDRTAIPVFSPDTGVWQLDFVPEDLGGYGTQIWRYATGAPVGVFVQNESQPSGSVGTLFYRLLYLDALCYDSDFNYYAEEGKPCPPSKPKIGVRVRSKVIWGISGRDHEVEIEETLYDWY